MLRSALRYLSTNRCSPPHGKLYGRADRAVASISSLYRRPTRHSSSSQEATLETVRFAFLINRAKSMERSRSSQALVTSEQLRRVVPYKYDASYSALRTLSDIHTKERCCECGCWKPKSDACAHCIRRPNRAQARLAQARQVAQEMELKFRPPLYPTGIGYLVVPSAHARPASSMGRGAASAPPPPPPPKEKCHCCGLWIAKDSVCHFCAKRPNRAQARRAQARGHPAPKPFFRAADPPAMPVRPSTPLTRVHMTRQSSQIRERVAEVSASARATIRSLKRPKSAPSLRPESILHDYMFDGELGVSGSVERRPWAVRW
jgi:hypothetical protein